MSITSTPQGRFHMISIKAIEKYAGVVDNMNKQGILDTNAIDPSWPGLILALGREINDQDTFSHNIEIAIEKSLPTWIFAHHFDENEKRANTEFLRQNITMFLTGIPESFSGIPAEFDRLAKLRDNHGNYVIGDDFVNAAYEDAEAIVRTMIGYLEQFIVPGSERTLVIPFKNRLIEYTSVTPNHPKFKTLDIGLWRYLFPKRQRQ